MTRRWIVSGRHWMVSDSLLVVLTLVLGFVCGGTVNAGSSKQDSSQKRAVVIVGNNHSIDPGVEDLHYADDDAVLYAEMLAPFADQLTLLTLLDDDTQRRFPGYAERTRRPTRAEMNDVLTSTFKIIMAWQAAGIKKTELMFVFVGHGSVDREGQGFVHLEDGRFARGDLFHEVISSSPATYTHVIVDACNAYSLVAGRGATGPDAPDDPGALLLDQFLAGQELEDFPDVGVLAATSQDRVTHEWSKIQAGLFSFQMRSALSGAADINGDGQLEYSEVAAFLTAANANLGQASKRLSVFAWAPKRHRRAPLLDLRRGRGSRRVAIGPAVRGKLSVESENGDVWVGAHASGEQTVTLVLPEHLGFYVRSSDGETNVEAGAADVSVLALGSKVQRVAERGAVDAQFEKSLFGIPFGRSYYLGFMANRPNMLTVDFQTDPVAVSQEDSLLAVGVGYTLGMAPLLSDHIEHGLRAQADVRWRSGVSWTGVVELGRAWVEDPTATLSRLSVMAGANWRTQISHNLAVILGLDVGYAMLTVAAEESSVDPLVLVGKFRTGMIWCPSRGFALEVGAAGSGFLVTMNTKESIRGAPVGYVMIFWD